MLSGHQRSDTYLGRVNMIGRQLVVRGLLVLRSSSDVVDDRSDGEPPLLLNLSFQRRILDTHPRVIQVWLTLSLSGHLTSGGEDDTSSADGRHSGHDERGRYIAGSPIELERKQRVVLDQVHVEPGLYWKILR